MICHNFLTTPTLVVDYFYEAAVDNANLAFVFSPSLNRELNGNSYGGEVLFRNGFDTVVFKVSNDDWFQSVPPNLFEVINNTVSKKKYLKKISYGSSMGGYAAIVFSKYLALTSVYVFSPQYSIDQDFDTRWAAFSKKIYFNYRIDAETVNQNSRYFIFYDNKDLDAQQVQKLLNFLPLDKTQEIKLPFTGHPCVHYLSEIGLLKDLLVNIATHDSDLNTDLLRYKNKSKSYLYNISLHLFRKNHYTWSLSFVESALKIDAKMAVFHRHKGNVLEKLGLLADATVALKTAISFSPMDAHYLNGLAILLGKQGFLDEAIEHSKKSILLAPDNPHFYGQLSNLFFKAGSFLEALSFIDSALSINASIAGFHRHKSVVLDGLGMKADAVISIRKAIALDPTVPHDIDRLDFLLKKNGGNLSLN